MGAARSFVQTEPPRPKSVLLARSCHGSRQRASAVSTARPRDGVRQRHSGACAQQTAWMDGKRHQDTQRGWHMQRYSTAGKESAKGRLCRAVTRASSTSLYLIRGMTGPNCSSSTMRTPSCTSARIVGS